MKVKKGQVLEDCDLGRNGFRRVQVLQQMKGSTFLRKPESFRKKVAHANTVDPSAMYVLCKLVAGEKDVQREMTLLRKDKIRPNARGWELVG